MTTVQPLQNRKVKSLSSEKSSSVTYFKLTLFLYCFKILLLSFLVSIFLVCSRNPFTIYYRHMLGFKICPINSLQFLWFRDFIKVLTMPGGTPCDKEGPAHKTLSELFPLKLYTPRCQQRDHPNKSEYPKWQSLEDEKQRWKKVTDVDDKDTIFNLFKLQ